MSNITPFHNRGRYTDIRVCISDVLAKLTKANKGIIVLFDEEGMHTHFVCKSSELAFAAADLLVKSTTNEDEVA